MMAQINVKLWPLLKAKEKSHVLLWEYLVGSLDMGIWEAWNAGEVTLESWSNRLSKWRKMEEVWSEGATDTEEFSASGTNGWRRTVWDKPTKQAMTGSFLGSLRNLHPHPQSIGKLSQDLSGEIIWAELVLESSTRLLPEECIGGGRSGMRRLAE